MSPTLLCSVCGAQAQAAHWAWRCDECGGPLEFADEPVLENIVSLGEPETPLVELTLERVTVTAKLEGALPTGSFKDRGSRVVATALRAAGVERAVIDSSGNAGASLAAYCARAGIECDVYAPSSASPAKLAQIEAFGAYIKRISGSREDVAIAAREAAKSHAYAAHGWTPWFLLGTASFASELHAQLGRAPDAIVLPVGAGTLLLGISRGFEALVREGVSDKQPRLYGVQSTACAPLVHAFEDGRETPTRITPGDTAAEGIKIANPPRGRQIIAAVRRSGGALVAVDDSHLWSAFARLSAAGVLVEPTSAIAFAALDRLPIASSESVVVPVTATGLKAVDAIMSVLEDLGRREQARKTR
jgi:threonine synthase